MELVLTTTCSAVQFGPNCTMSFASHHPIGRSWRQSNACVALQLPSTIVAGQGMQQDEEKSQKFSRRRPGCWNAVGVRPVNYKEVCEERCGKSFGSLTSSACGRCSCGVQVSLFAQNFGTMHHDDGIFESMETLSHGLSRDQHQMGRPVPRFEHAKTAQGVFWVSGHSTGASLHCREMWFVSCQKFFLDVWGSMFHTFWTEAVSSHDQHGVFLPELHFRDTLVLFLLTRLIPSVRGHCECGLLLGVQARHCGVQSTGS